MSILKGVAAAGLLLFSSIGFAAVDINTANEDALSSVKGIGASKAAAIVKYRTEVGGFKTVDELVKVKGIGPKLLERLRGAVKVGAK